MIPKDMSGDIESLQEITRDLEDLISEIIATVFCELHENISLKEIQNSELFKSWKNKHIILRGRLLVRGWKPYEWEDHL